MAQYPIMDEPTRDEFIAFYKVQRYFEQTYVAEWLDGMEPLTDDEFSLLAHWFHKADFSQEESDYLYYEYHRIINERR